ncbi:glycosyltransferase family A protein [Aurantiacibacter odishensis]|uniref:glycosyltransferase family A protein n=1 Tax=Aurantiacibacter odishensis TaxID=1155476 RepID=UPI0013C416B9|nr:glycosyltransferase family A protein [Aurantiacibacter odishensis]
MAVRQRARLASRKRCPVTSFAVVIPTFNRAETVGTAIESVLAQDEKPEEIIVVDDGSTDDTPAVLAGFSDAITVIRKDNGGVASARNEGCFSANSDWITFLDSDDIWLPERMTTLRRDIAAADAQVVAHVSDLRFRGLRDPSRTFFDAIGLELAAGTVRAVEQPLTRFLHSFYLQTAAIRADAFRMVGGFDTSFQIDEDTELAHRIAALGPFVVRGSIAAEVIRTEGDEEALSLLRGKDPAQACTLKERQFRGILARPDIAGSHDLARKALLDNQLDRAQLAKAGRISGSKTMILLKALAIHPNKMVGAAKIARSALGYNRSNRGVDRTGGVIK